MIEHEETGAAARRFLAGGGDMGARIRARDWAVTQLGPSTNWPSPLKTLVSLLLSSGQPMFLAWGFEQIWFYNDAFIPILGHKHPHALGERSEAVWVEAWEVLKPLFDRVFAGEPVHMEDFGLMLNRRGRLEEAHFSFSYTPIFAEHGEVSGLFGACLETTAQVIAIREKEAAERRLQLALSAGEGIGTWDWDVKSDRVVADARFAHLYGVDPALAKEGAPISQFTAQIHSQDLPMVQRQITEALRAGGDFTEYRLHQHDGSIRWVIAQGRVIADADGVPIRFPGATIDITERKNAEEALYELNASLESEVESRTRERDRVWRLSPDLMAVTDVTGKMVRCNPAWQTLLGWTDEEVNAGSYLNLVHPDDVEFTQSQIIDVRDESAPLRFENRYRAKDGSYRWQQWTVVPEQGLIYCVARDITEERKKAEALEVAEEALRQSQKMEAVGQLTGGIAHDFNNLLQGISGSLDLLLRRVMQGRYTELDRFIAGAVTSANRAAALTHRLLAFSRRQPLDPRPVRTNDLIASMEDMLRRVLGERIELALVLSEGLWQTICDPNQLESAILNLVINARDAMPSGGKLTIETSNEQLDAIYAARQRDLKPGQYVCASVSDTGCGMSADTIDKAFEPFFTTKPIGQGTGLGLSMIYGFARQSEGCAIIYSELGRGTTVKLYLPRFRGESVGDEPVVQLRDPHTTSTNEVVLVVEDEPIVRGLIVEVLTELGYRVLEAADGPAGLDVVQSKRRIDLLITDIGLPGLNGRQIAEAARRVRPNCKVLFMTGYAENAAIAAGFLQPGMSMITKPFAMETLATRISEILAYK